MAINLSIRVLRAFVVLADCRHFTRAAARCHLSQSAFSQLIRRLEEEAGTALFNRNTRNVALTAEGELLADSARRLLADIESSFAELKDRTACRKGRVAVAALPSLAADTMPRVFAACRRRFPGVALELFDGLSDRCLELVRQGRVDFALTAPGSRLAEFDSRLLLSDSFHLVCHRDHPLASKRRVGMQDLAGCELIHFARTSSVRQHLEPALADVPVLHSGFEVEHLATVAGLVANGLGVSVVPALTLFQFRRPELVAIPVDVPALVRPILFVQRKGIALSPPAAAMVKMIEAMLPVRRAARQRARSEAGRAATPRGR